MLGIGIALGIILGVGGYKFLELLILKYKKKKTPTPPLLRRGIVTRGYTSESGAGEKENFSVQFEVGEIERTKDKSKIHIINMIPSGSSFESNLTGVYKIFNKSWVDTKDIEWIEKSARAKRKEILKDVLS